MMAQVKYRVRRRYQEENLEFDSEAKVSTNRFISPIEHCRTDAPYSPQARVTAECDPMDTDPLPTSEDNGNDNGDVIDELSDDEDMLPNGDEGDVVVRWDAVFEAAMPDESDDANDETEDDETVNDNIDLSEIDCFEKRRLVLPDLPEENDPKFPQEDALYFKKKKPDKYVRTDKYPLSVLYKLCTLLPEEDEFPSILSVYSKN